MSTGQIYLFAYSEADYAAKASLLKALDPTSTVTIEHLKFWDHWWNPKYHRETFLVELNLHPTFSQHRQVHSAVVRYGRAICRT